MKDFTDQQAIAAIATRAAQDADFRKRLLCDPRGAIEEMTGVPVPDTLRIQFIEKDPEIDVVIVLPDLIEEEGELSEQDITGVSGGTGWGCQDVSTS